MINKTICCFDPQYDLSASQFSPDGRVFQVEYAQKAVENSGSDIRNILSKISLYLTSYLY